MKGCFRIIDRLLLFNDAFQLGFEVNQEWRISKDSEYGDLDLFECNIPAFAWID
jgi:hypothetical protein